MLTSIFHTLSWIFKLVQIHYVTQFSNSLLTFGFGYIFQVFDHFLTRHGVDFCDKFFWRVFINVVLTEGFAQQKRRNETSFW